MKRAAGKTSHMGFLTTSRPLARPPATIGVEKQLETLVLVVNLLPNTPALDRGMSAVGQ